MKLSKLFINNSGLIHGLMTNSTTHMNDSKTSLGKIQCQFVNNLHSVTLWIDHTSDKPFPSSETSSEVSSATYLDASP